MFLLGAAVGTLTIVGCQKTANSEPVERGTVLFVGDSLTNGHGLGPETARYPEILGERWGRKIVNISRSGQRLEGAADWLEKELKNNPTSGGAVAALVALGANDQMAGRSAGESAVELRKVVDLLKAHGARVFIVPCLVPLRSQGYAAMYKAEAEASGEAMSTDIVGCYRSAEGGIDSDGVHPSGLGHIAIAEALDKDYGMVMRLEKD